MNSNLADIIYFWSFPLVIIAIIVGTVFDEIVAFSLIKEGNLEKDSFALSKRGNNQGRDYMQKKKFAKKMIKKITQDLIKLTDNYSNSIINRYEYLNEWLSYAVTNIIRKERIGKQAEDEGFDMNDLERRINKFCTDISNEINRNIDNRFTNY